MNGGRLRSAVRPPWADRNVGIILAARFAMSGSRAIAGVVTVLYLAAEGFSGVELGLLFLCVALASAAMSTGIGLLSDRVGRRPFLVALPLLTAAAGTTYAFSRTPTVLFLFAALGSLGRGAGAGGGNVGPYQPAESAFVAEAVPAEHRAAAFGRLTFASTLGALLGGLLVGVSRAGPHTVGVAATRDYRPAFLAAAVLAAVAGLLALRLEERRVRRLPPAPAKRGIRWPRSSWPVLWRFWITNGVNGLAIGMIGPFLSYWLARRYGADAATIGLLFALVNFFSMWSSLTAAAVARHLGTVRAIVAARAVTGVLLIPMALAPGFWIAGGIYILRMMVQRIGLPLRQSFTQDVADPDERASVAALSNLPAQGAMAGSQVLAGYLFGEVSLFAPFALAAVLQCTNAALYSVLFRGRGGPPGPAAAPADGPGEPATPGLRQESAAS